MARTREAVARAAHDTSEEAGGAPAPGLNLAVLWGACSAGVEVRTLESGTRVASLALRTPTNGRRRGRTEPSTTSVPVTVWEPPAWLETVGAGESLVVVGMVRRRFFTTRSGARGAKAEVEALTVARATGAQLERAWQRAAGVLEAIA